MTQPPAAPPLPPPPRRPVAPSRAGKSGGGLFKLLVIVGALLALASWLGQRKPAEPDTQPIAADAPARPAAPAAAAAKPQAVPANATATPKDARFSVSSDGLLLTIDGDVGSRFAHDLKLALDANPSLQRIVITSGGGYAGPGLDAARQISRRNLIVRVKSYCASMCVGLWAAAAAREMEPDALIGLHQWRMPCATLPDAERRDCEYTVQFLTQHDAAYDAWLRSAGFNARLLALQETTSADDIAVLTAPQLWDNGVDFSVVDAQGQRMTREQARAFLAAKYGRAGRG